MGPSTHLTCQGWPQGLYKSIFKYKYDSKCRRCSKKNSYQEIWNRILKFVGDILDVDGLHAIFRAP